MIYKTFKEWKDGQWFEDGEPRKQAYTKDELLLVEMGWKYGFDAGKANKELSDEEIEKVIESIAHYGVIAKNDYVVFARAIIKASRGEE
jgi:hypothetical protein